jgi:hypothetical protein
MIKNIKHLLLASLVIASCSSDDEVIADSNSTDGAPLTAGTADFSNYVALGDSFAAGFSDNALFAGGQKNAYPNIIASQFALVGGGEFNTPFMADNIGGFSSNGVQITQFSPRLYLATGNVPTPVDGPSTTDISTHLSGPFNNFGIPGAKVVHLEAIGYGSSAGNPYFARMASTPTATVVDDALATNPTFFSLWIGGNDALGYATSGGDQTVASLTPTATFDSAFNSIVGKLAANGRKGVIANLPNVSTLPFFTTVPYNPLNASAIGQGNNDVGVATINALNAQLYTPMKGALTFLGEGDRINLLSTTGENPLLIKDESITNLAPQLLTILQNAPFNMPAQQAGLFANVFGQARHAKSSDLVLLTTRNAIGATPTASDSGIGMAPPAPLDKFGITYPLQDKHVLTASEISEIQIATDSYNQTIADAAATYNLAFVDAKDLMNQLNTTGITANNYTLTTTFVTGGMFSLDGVHPSPRGYAFIANQFLKAVNNKYNSNFKGVNVGDYRILYPKDSNGF